MSGRDTAAGSGSGTGSDTGSDTGRQVHQSETVDKIAGVGLVAYGVVHLLIGWLAFQLAIGSSEGQASSTGAIRQLAQQPYGQALVWLLAVGMALMVLYRLVEAVLGYRDEDGAKRWAKRALSLGKAIVYGSIAVTAVSVATTAGSGGGGGGGTDSMTATLMSQPGGQLLVGAVGLGIIAFGVGMWVSAYRESYLDKLDAQGKAGDTGKAYKILGRVGYVAKGFALGVVGGLFVYAAVTHQAKESGGLDQALQTVREQPFGPVLLAATGIGFVAYGLFTFAVSRHLDR